MDKYISERELDIPECRELQVVVHHWCDKCFLRLPLHTHTHTNLINKNSAYLIASICI